jgi:hypothetical protein
MVTLNCRTLNTTIDSLARLTESTTDELRDRVQEAERIAEASSGEFHIELARTFLTLSQMTESRLLDRIDTAHYFHASRTADTRSFDTSGLLPLSDSLGLLFRDLVRIADDRISQESWSALCLRIRERTADPDDMATLPLRLRVPEFGGPDARLVRDAHFWPVGAERDFLAGPPEIVEDFLAELLASTGIDLTKAYMEATVPCIVEFYSPRVGWREFVSAIAYVSDQLARRVPQSVAARGGYAGGGVGVPRSRIVSIEVPA